ncbi:MAG: hypothetical protein JSR09_06740 [Bacteroidetes bacterium]|nr:hypothetical protein [Bacteroidota bacterium]MBS1649388.1 hypothetical protein [Bacteroidota bacterium]
MAEDKQLNPQESLQLITETIQKAKGGFHETGVSAILWGSVVSIAGLVSFVEVYFNFYIGFDIWLIVLAAIIPQIFISIKENKNKKVIAHDEKFLDATWMVYGISIFALIFYINIVPGVSEQMITHYDNSQLFTKNITTNELTIWKPYIFSQSSLYLILFSIPTLVTGIARKFKPMLLGGLFCLVFFITSCYTTNLWDMLLLALAGIFNWLIPGLILRSRFLKGKTC